MAHDQWDWFILAMEDSNENLPFYGNVHKAWSRKPELTKKVDYHMHDNHNLWLGLTQRSLSLLIGTTLRYSLRSQSLCSWTSSTSYRHLLFIQAWCVWRANLLTLQGYLRTAELTICCISNTADSHNQCYSAKNGGKFYKNKIETNQT